MIQGSKSRSLFKGYAIGEPPQLEYPDKAEWEAAEASERIGLSAELVRDLIT
jgi:hypothetical protein